jgi:nucleoside-triphosphatase THEP1
MEMKSNSFRNIVTKVLSSDKKVVAIVHLSLVNNITSNFKKIHVFEVTEQNRDEVHQVIARAFLEDQS